MMRTMADVQELFPQPGSIELERWGKQCWVRPDQIAGSPLFDHLALGALRAACLPGNPSHRDLRPVGRHRAVRRGHCTTGQQ
jgi:hypothetical protein